MTEGIATMPELYETTQIVELLQITRGKLNWIRSRHPDIKPARRVGAGTCLWSETTFERIKQLVQAESRNVSR